VRKAVREGICTANDCLKCSLTAIPIVSSNKPEWIKDSRFVTNADRVAHREELEELVESVTKTKTTQEWLEILEGSGMPYAAINDVKATLEHEHSTSTRPIHPSLSELMPQ